MGEMGGEGELMLARFSEWVLSAPLKDDRLATALLCLTAAQVKDQWTRALPPPHTCSYFFCSLESGFSHATTVHTLRELRWPLKSGLSEAWVCSM